ncbi:Putative IQ motif and ankyrin repeat domain-containing protein [Durusdinium trenchii]|uniref:IQ motif and ankyrin repeat domain-containing protein n=1 Tax=Durusdinium trenchii TaxID=1381693 RepID=A0ABP0R1K1_9DINO
MHSIGRLQDTRALLEAAFEGDEDLVLKFLKKGLPVDAAPASGVTALSEAAAAGKPRVVELLLERKARRHR